MKLEKLIKDSFGLGLISGIVTLTLFYYAFTGIRIFLIGYTGNGQLLKPPSVQMLSMVVNVILFRILLINYDKEKTAKGVLFITVIVMLAYFYIFFRINRG